MIAQAEGRGLPAGVVLVALDRRPVLARRVQRRRHGPGRHRPRARRLRRSHRGSRRSAPTRAPAPPICATMTADGARPLPRGSEDDSRRDRVPLRLGGRGVHVLRAIPARPRSPRPRHRAPAAGLGERAGRRRRGRAGSAGRSRAIDASTAQVSSLVPRASPGSTCTRPVRRRRPIPRRRAPSGGLAEARRTAGGSWRETPADSSLTGPRRARQRRRRDRLGPRRFAGAGLDPEQNRAAARSALASLRAAAQPRPARRVLVQNRTGVVLGCAQSRRGTGAPRASPPSARDIAGWSGDGPGGLPVG